MQCTKKSLYLRSIDETEIKEHLAFSLGSRGTDDKDHESVFPHNKLQVFR
jgi:hypothetical protein